METEILKEKLKSEKNELDKKRQELDIKWQKVQEFAEKFDLND